MHAFGSHLAFFVVHEDHRPDGLLDGRRFAKKNRPQNATAAVSVNGAAVFFAGQKAKTTTTIRAVDPVHRKR